VAIASVNATGTVGMAPNAKIVPLKFASGNSGYTSDAIEGIEYAKSLGIKIINCSFGSTINNPALYDAMKNSDALFVCAAGNSGINTDETPVFPACFDLTNVLSVASMGNTGTLAAASNYGSNIDLAAPGENIETTQPNEVYATLSGTSMAVPFVAGTAALILSKFPDATYQEIALRIKNGSVSMNSLSGKVSTGGRLDAYVSLAGKTNISSDINVNSESSTNPTSNEGKSIIDQQMNLMATIDSKLLAQVHYGENGVSAASGNYSKLECDMVTTSPAFNIEFTRTYNSTDTRGRLLGSGWTFGFEGYVDDAATTVVSLPNGKILKFTNSNNVFTGDTTHATLVKKTDGTYELTTLEQYKYLFTAGGWLYSMKDKYGNAVTIDIDANTGKINRIIDAVGRHYMITYGTNGFISSIKDPLGRIVSYNYNSSLLLSSVTLPDGTTSNYEYDAYNQLQKTKDTNNSIKEEFTYLHGNSDTERRINTYKDSLSNIFTFNYNVSTKVTTITDSNNRNITKKYDNEYYIIESTDPEGKTTYVTYFLDASSKNKFGEEKTITDRNGNFTTIERDSNGNITKIIKPDASFSLYTYDSKNNNTIVTDEEGKKVFYRYDTDGIFLVEKAQPIDKNDNYNLNGVGNDSAKFSITSYAYYSDIEAQSLGYRVKGLLKTVTDPKLNTTIFTYDCYGNVKTGTDALGNTIKNNYNIIGWKTSTVSPLGYKTSYTYDSMGRVEKTVNNDGETNRTVYDNLGRIVKQISPNLYNSANDNIAAHTYSGDVGTRFSYKTNGLLNSITDSAGNVTSYLTYDIYGNVLTEKKPNGGVYKKEYDIMNQLTNIWFKNLETDSDSTYKQLEGNAYAYLSVTNSGVTKNGTKLTKTIYSDTAANNQTTQSIYDFDGRLVKQIYQDTTFSTTEYYLNGLTYKTTDPKGSVTTTYYDGLNRAIKVESPFETISSTTYYSTKNIGYDKNDNVIWEENSSNKPGEAASLSKTEYEYNAKNLLTKVKLGSGTNFNYTQYYYDSEGRKIRQYTGLSSPLTITGLDTITSGADSSYATAKYEYGSNGKLITYTDPRLQSDYFDYDKNGNMIEKTDRNGNVITSTYDSLNRQLSNSVVTPTGTGNVSSTFTYKFDLGRETAVKNGVTTTTNYDQMGRVIKEYDSVSEKNYTFDRNGTKLTFVAKVGTVEKINQSFEYNNMNRLYKVYVSAVLKATYTYDNNGNRLSLTNNGNSTTVDYTYNLANKIKTLVNKKGTTVLSSYSYEYILDGNQWKKADVGNNKVTNYLYDNMGRLRQEKETVNSTVTSTKDYTFDDYSNRAGMTVTEATSYSTAYIYDLNNRLTTETKTTGTKTETTGYTYDNNGNQTIKQTVTKIGDTIQGTATTNNTYDGLNQLTTTNDGTVSSSYDYNTDGLRTSKTVAGTVAKHIWDGADIVLETDGSNAVKSKYIRGINLIYSDVNSVQKWYQFNAHGDVVQLTDNAGTVTKNYDYDAFGVEKNPDAADTNAFRYCGEYFDKETGNIYLRARYYDPDAGRFISEDSVRGDANDPLSLNLYTYSSNNPIMFIDPTGHMNYLTQTDDLLAGLAEGMGEYLVGLATSPYALIMMVKSLVSGDMTLGMLAEAGLEGLVGNYAYVISNGSVLSPFKKNTDAEVREFGIHAGAVICDLIMLFAGGAIAAKVIKSLTATKAGAKIAAELENIVYTSKANGVVNYVGITNNLARRAAEQLASKGIKIEALIEGLSRYDARAVEQALIEIHGLGKNGGSLLNKINSIAKSNPIYAAALKRGLELLESIGY